MTILLGLAQLVLLLSGVVVLASLLRGPTVFDRVLALETLALGVVGFLLLRADALESRLYLDGALGLALFSFIGAIVFAHFAGRGEIDDD